jgi:uncharacterized protein YjbI with pentapeptide repeats
MANQHHLDILKSGIERWNNWRNAETQVVPDLANGDIGSKPHFTRANLHGANLSGFNFGDSILDSCDFSNANLVRAELSDAIVSYSRFTGPAVKAG